MRKVYWATRVKLANAIAVLHEQLVTPARMQRAFEEAVAARTRWPITDPFDYEDICVGELPGPAPEEWTVDVDVIRKPKQGAGERPERLVDIFTGSLLQVVANVLKEKQHSSGSSVRPESLQLPSINGDTYEDWAKSLTNWLRSQIINGRTVVKIDFADFFPNIRRRQMTDAMVAAGLTPTVADALLVIFDHINMAKDSKGQVGEGLPIIPDEIAWIIADLVLEPFDKSVLTIDAVPSYIRWVDDCYFACYPEQTLNIIDRMSKLAGAFGFTVNSTKTRILASLDDLDRELLQHEHGLLSELFELTQRSPREAVTLERFFAQVIDRLSSGKPEHARVIKRLYTLAGLISSNKLVASASSDLKKFPAAERQIFEYLWRLKWPGEAHDILVDALLNSSNESRQIIVLELLLQCNDSTLPKVAEDACFSLLSGNESIHDLVSCLAFIVVLTRIPDRRETVTARLGAYAPCYQSAMARRLAYEVLSITSKQLPVKTDTSPTVSAIIDHSNYLQRRPYPRSRAPDDRSTYRWSELDKLFSSSPNN